MEKEEYDKRKLASRLDDEVEIGWNIIDLL
jgi:hypothetical protein